MNVRDFNVKTSSPDEDRLETVLHFVGDTFPRVFVINRLGREVDYVTVDGERYERVRECEVESSLHWDPYHESDFYEHELSCGHTVTSDYGEPPLYCEVCGARVVVE